MHPPEFTRSDIESCRIVSVEILNFMSAGELMERLDRVRLGLGCLCKASLVLRAAAVEDHSRCGALELICADGVGTLGSLDLAGNT